MKQLNINIHLPKEAMKGEKCEMEMDDDDSLKKNPVVKAMAKRKKEALKESIYSGKE